MLESLVVTLDEEQFEFRLQSSLAGVSAAVDCRNVQIDPDPEIKRTYLQLPEDGIDIVFGDEQLSSVFLYLAPHPPRIDRFQGGCNLLSDSFFLSPSSEQFALEMKALGLAQADRKYPNAVDFLNDHIRVRLERRENRSMILFDDGSFIRKAH